MDYRLVVRSVVLPVLSSSLLLLVTSVGRAAALPEGPTFADRVAAQRALEQVAYRHQLGAKRPFEEAAAEAVLERKVRTYLKKSVALERFWSTPVTSAMLDAEIDRLARSTRDAGRLAEMYAALGNDPMLVRECLARPLLVDRMTRSFFQSDASILTGPLPTEAKDRLAWDVWWARVEGSLDETSVHPAFSPSRTFAIPSTVAPSRACTASDTWDNQSLDEPPDPRADHVAVWTGTEMIIWGGRDAVRRLNSGGIYNPSTDTWRSMTGIGAPEINQSFGADEGFWTGHEMLLWRDGSRGGSRYDPVLDQWKKMSTAGAPVGGVQVWIGNRLFVFDAPAHAAAAYDPASDSWSALDTTGAPSLASSAIWTGRYVVTVSSEFGRYEPASGTWLPVSKTGAPSGFSPQFAAAIGSDVLVALASGYRYSPDTDTWSGGAPIPSAILSGPALASRQVWTGHELLVWGGKGSTSTSYLGGPYRYNPSTDAWTVSAVPDGLEPRGSHTLIWTGNLMLAWGGKRRDPYFGTGGRYDPSTDKWTPMSTGGGPGPVSRHVAVWTGNEMLIWGGHVSIASGPNGGGARYNPATDSWASLPDPYPVPVARGHEHTAVWTGDEMIIWGSSPEPGGGRYNPISNTWQGISMLGTPAGVNGHSSIWTGERMIVWGGEDKNGEPVGTGAAYDPVSDTWTELSTEGAPSSRANHSAVWTGSEMIIWGGSDNSGGRYDPARDIWRAMSEVDAPFATGRNPAVWTGHEMIVAESLYEPTSDTWRTIAPGRPEGSAVWTGKDMIVWGSEDPLGQSSVGIGSRYDPTTDKWSSISLAGAPTSRVRHTAIWTGDRMIVWGGGDGVFQLIGNGGAYVRDGENHLPVAVAQTTPRVECTSPAGAHVILDGTASSDADAAPTGNPEFLSFEWIEMDGASSRPIGTGATLDIVLPLGAHQIGLLVTDACGATGAATTEVFVEDTTAPTLTLEAEPPTLWPADQRLRNVVIHGTAADACDASPSITLTGVSSNESIAKDVSGAQIGTADFGMFLRAARNGGGPGRVYRLIYTARDASGNAEDKVVEISVPHDRRTSGAAPKTARTEAVAIGALPAK